MSSDKLIGPALPPLFRKDGSESDESENDCKKQIFSFERSTTCFRFFYYYSSCCVFSLRPAVAGPALPPGYKRGEPSGSSDESEPEVAFKRSRTGEAAEPPVLGPALPPGFHRAASDSDDGEDGEGFPGPALPPGYQAECSSSEGEDEDVIGPMPAKGPIQDSVALEFERRALRMKEKLTGEVVSRETWMTELPPELQHIGLGARTFKKRSGPENNDRSIWTDTPADRERKAQERLERKKTGEAKNDRVPQVSRRDVEMAEKVSKYNDSKRGESLMSLHSKKLKEKAKETADKPVERRPFDRDEDLQVNRFDEAQKQRLLKKSQELNTRFSHSKDRMFL
uniref:GPALPP motifs-containing protein 1 n=1 Tax=Xiphophorus couchianus TaxID=32473 RepID=A0A3B5KXA0_9TELE